jgi:hypothetical protein
LPENDLGNTLWGRDASSMLPFGPKETMTSTERQLTVFVSSTCYDLAQVRADLSQFITAMGYSPIMSESRSFPVDPERSTVESCIAALREHSAVFVLVVGGRYGAVVHQDKSITNLEYDHAKAIGIPRYVFVQKSILYSLPVWKKNRMGDFSSIVDSNKVFEFVETLHDKRDQWVFSFEEAKDIEETLRYQLSYLFARLLTIHRKIVASPESETILSLGGQAMRIAIEKPIAWEHRLFLRMLADQIAAGQYLKWDAEYGICTTPTEKCDDLPKTLNAISRKMTQIGRLVDALSTLINKTLTVAVGPPGQPGDVTQIAYTARRTGEIFRALIQWGIDFKKLDVPEPLTKLVAIASGFNRQVIASIEDMSEGMLKEMNQALERVANGEKGITVSFNVKLQLPDIGAFTNELNSLRIFYGIPHQEP